MKILQQFGNIAMCTKQKKTVGKSISPPKWNGKVIHIKKDGNIEKMELYTKLCTLSTWKVKNQLVYIEKNANRRFVKK